MSAKSNVVPIDDHAAGLRANVEFAEWLRDELAANRVATMSVRGVDITGEPFTFDIIQINADTLRYMMIGLLEEAKALLTVEP